MLLRLPGDSEAAARWTAALWLALALSNGGVFGAVYLGQFSLVAGAGLVGIALIAAGAAWRPWTLGLLMTMVKPHLSLVAVLFAMARKGRSDARRIAVALGVLAALSLPVLLVDPAFLRSYRESLALHAASQYAAVATPEALFGLPGMLADPAPRWLLAAMVLAAALPAAVLRLDTRPRATRDTILAAFAAVVILGTMLFPHKAYDFAVYSVVFLVAARQRVAVQAVLLLPLLVVWRPALLERAGLDQIMGANLALIGLAAGFAALAASGWLRQRRSAPPAG